jgi:hypothetical protein
MLQALGCHASGIDPTALGEAARESARQAVADDETEVLGWHVEVSQDRLRWRGCASVDACSFQDRETPGDNVLSVDRLGQTTVHAPDGPRLADVERIRLRHRGQIEP